MQGEHEDLLLLLLREGSRSQAIQFYREETGASADDARDAVSSFAKRNGLGHHWLLVISLVFLLVGIIGWVVAAMAG